MAKILVVDDDKMHQKILSTVLGRGDHEVVVADQGDQALESIANDPPNLLILDMGLPGMSGLDVLREILAQGKPDGMRIIVFTANPHLGGEEEMQYIDHFLTKPFSPVDLAEVVNGLL